jgi:anti-sigma factor RsiW
VSHDAATEDELVALLRGELDRERTTEVAEHLRGCDDCRLELVDVAEVHGSLTAAARLLRAAQPHAGADGGPAASRLIERRTGAAHRAPSLPPLRVPASRPGRARVLSVVAACAAAVLVVGGVAFGLDTLRDRRAPTPAQPSTAAGRSVDLRPLAGSGPGAGRVTMAAVTGASTEMTISVGLDPAGSGRFYYAWLLDPKTNKMLPLGVVSTGGKTHFDVSADLVKRYHTVDISLEDDDGDPVHSATSVLRAAY